MRCQARCARAARRTVVALFGMVKALFSPFVALAGMVGAGLGYVAKLVSGGGSAPAIADDSG